MSRRRPFFEVPGPKAGARRLLLVSWNFPPQRTAGALRWQKLAGLAAEHGWSLDVITAEPNPEPSSTDRSLIELPPSTRLYGVDRRQVLEGRLEDLVWRVWRRIAPRRPGPPPIPGDAAAAGSAPPSRAELESLPPEAIRWTLGGRALLRAWTAHLEFRRDGSRARRVAELGIRLGRETRYHAVVSCGPPHLAHTAGRGIATALGLPLVIDLRDPFALVRRLPAPIASPLWFALARRHERPAVARAGLVVANTDALRVALEREYPEAAGKLVTVMNGCDDDLVPVGDKGTRFTITYAGALYLDRDPALFFRAAARVVRELGLGPEDFAIEFVGQTESYGGRTLAGIAAAEVLGGYVRMIPRVPRPEALRLMSRAAMLLNLPQDSAFAIPSKIFDYLLFDAWLLVLAARGTPTEQLLRGSGVDLVEPDDAEGIAAAIRRRVEAFRRGERPTRVALDERFTRRYQARILFEGIDRLVTEGSHA